MADSTVVPAETPAAVSLPTFTLAPVLKGGSPDGWESVKIPATDVSFSVPPGCNALDVTSGLVSYICDGGEMILVTVLEEIPASKLSLARLMDVKRQLDVHIALF